MKGERESIKNLLEIFDGLLEYLTEEVSESSSQNGGEWVDRCPNLGYRVLIIQYYTQLLTFFFLFVCYQVSLPRAWSSCDQSSSQFGTHGQNTAPRVDKNCSFSVLLNSTYREWLPLENASFVKPCFGVPKIKKKYFQCNKDFFGVFAIFMTMATQKRRETDTDHRGGGLEFGGQTE